MSWSIGMCESDVVEVFGDTGCEADSGSATKDAERLDYQ
jgi:hypothetical protein